MVSGWRPESESDFCGDLADTNQALVSLGSPAPTELGSLTSIAHLFGTTKPRTGIYALVLPNQCAYIGQALDVVRRFSQHRLRHEIIHAFTFVATKELDLNVKERELIFGAERAGITLTNVTYAKDIAGAADIDVIVSPRSSKTFACRSISGEPRRKKLYGSSSPPPIADRATSKIT